jgi:hypothetical protein
LKVSEAFASGALSKFHIQPRDQKYVTVMVELLLRQPKREAEYERRQADALDKIARSFTRT